MHLSEIKNIRDLVKASDVSEDDEVLFDNEWITVKQTDDEYIYTEGTPGVAILPIRQGENTMEVLLRKEENPLHDNFITIITGRTDDGESSEITAIRELKEEAGISGITEEDLVDMGDLLLGKDKPQPERVFIVNVTNGTYGEIEGDGSTYEENSKNFWIPTAELTKYILKEDDTYLLSVLGKLLAMLID